MLRSRLSEHSSEGLEISGSSCTGWPHFILDQLKLYQPDKSAEPKKSLYVSEGNARSLLLQKGHLKVTDKRKRTYKIFVSA